MRLAHFTRFQEGFILKSHIQFSQLFQQAFQKRCGIVALAASFSLGLALAGCDTKPIPKKTNEQAHEHSHAHEEGKHGGHLVDLEPVGAHAEWTHDDEKGILTIYLEELVAGGAKVEQVRVDIKLGEAETKKYDLEVSKADQHKIEGAIFNITSPELVTAMDVEGVKATLVVTADGKEHKGSLAHDHDHGHKH